MEYAFSELLSRDEILRILAERKLHIADMERLTENELLRIYKTFAMPRAKRDKRQTLHCHNTSVHDTLNNNNNNNNTSNNNNNNTFNEHQHHHDTIEQPAAPVCAIEMDMDPQDESESAEAEQKLPCLVGQKRERVKVASLVVDNTTEDFLSSATKRIKINWP